MTTYRYIKAGKLKAYKIGGYYEALDYLYNEFDIDANVCY